MPAYGYITGTPSTELSAVVPHIWVGRNTLYPYAQVLKLQKTKGLTPSECTFLLSMDKVNDSPVTLNRYLTFGENGDWNGQPQFGSRVVVTVDSTPIFSGHLMRRQDSGHDDSVIWTAVDDRDLLAGVPVRGALVYDEVDQNVKFCPSFSARTNPDGAWNCTFAQVQINHRRYSDTTNAVESVPIAVTAPVFTPYARHVLAYEYPNKTYTGTAETNGQICAWTPRRWLQYLCALANIVPAADGSDYPLIKGVDAETWRGIGNCNMLQWDYSKINSLRGVDPAITNPNFDPLDTKMPDVNFQGLAVLSALAQTLEVVGTHDFTLGMMAGREDNADRDIVGEITFFPVGWSGFKSDGQAYQVQLQRDGTVENAHTCIDFDLLMDASHTRDCVLVEGDVVKLETRLQCIVNANGTIDTANSTLAPAWTLEDITTQAGGSGVSQQTGFLQVIHGNPLTDAYKNNPGTYAKYPAAITTGNPPIFPNWLTADGNGGRPLAFAHSPEAVALARQCFPTVFRAFRVVTENLLDILQGVDDVFADPKKFAILNWKRTVLPTQLQYQSSDQSGGLAPGSAVEQINWLLSRYPIRVEVLYDGKKPESRTAWHDVGQMTGFYMTGDGLLWCETLGERIYPNYDSIIDPRPQFSGGGGDGWKNPGQFALRSFRINAAIPFDHRVYGYKTNPGQSIFAPEYVNALGGRRMLYVDSPCGYKEHHQKNSYPSALVNDIPAAGRMLASGDEREHAGYAAQRRLAYSTRVATNSIWRYAGICLGVRVGDWVERILFFSSDGLWQERPFPIRAPVGYVTFDFQNQKTEVGGIYSNLGGM